MCIEKMDILGTFAIRMDILGTFAMREHPKCLSIPNVLCITCQNYDLFSRPRNCHEIIKKLINFKINIHLCIVLNVPQCFLFCWATLQCSNVTKTGFTS